MPLNHKPTIPQLPQVQDFKSLLRLYHKFIKLQSNAHLGSGLVGGSVAGIEQSLNIKPLAEFGKNDKNIRLNLFCRWYPTYKSRVGELL